MRNTHKDMPAFPGGHESDCHNGMSLRDYFAAKAMQSVLDGSWHDLDLTPKAGLTAMENSAAFTYQIADAMMKAREL